MTNREIVQKINQDTQTSMRRSAAYGLYGPRVDEDDGYVVMLTTNVALSHIVMNVRYLMSNSC